MPPILLTKPKPKTGSNIEIPERPIYKIERLRKIVDPNDLENKVGVVEEYFGNGKRHSQYKEPNSHIGLYFSVFAVQEKVGQENALKYAKQDEERKNIEPWC